MSGTTTPSSPATTYLGSNPGLDRLLDNIQVEVPVVTPSVIRMMAWNTIEDFYLRTGWRRETAYWEMAPGIDSVDFNPFDETYLVAWMLDIRGLGRFKTIPPGLLLDLGPTGSVRSGSVLLGLKPVSFAAITAAGAGPELWSTWFDTIRCGVLSRLYAMPAKPYSSAQLALANMKEYSNGVSRARGIADGNFNGAPGGRWAFPVFANGRRKN